MHIFILGRKAFKKTFRKKHDLVTTQGNNEWFQEGSLHVSIGFMESLQHIIRCYDHVININNNRGLLEAEKYVPTRRIIVK